MDTIAFHRHVIATKEEFDSLSDQNVFSFLVKEDDNEHMQVFVDKIAKIASFIEDDATYLVINGKTINQYYNENYPDDLLLIGFLGEEMENEEAVIGELDMDEYYFLEDILDGTLIEEVIRKYNRL